MNAIPAHHAITRVQAISRIDTAQLFNGAMPDDSSSPIDQFIVNTDAINRIFLNYSTPLSGNPIPSEPATMALLGYMSAVESYFRALFRQLVEIDDHARMLAEPLDVSFAAARYHKPALLAEALHEGVSFAGKKTVVEMINKRLGIKGKFPNDVEEVLGEFSKICEIRHCCVHRFGRLGSKNAVTLGIEEHKSVLEKPFTPTTTQLQTIADALRTFVKTVNNFVFRELVQRIGTREAGHGPLYSEWTWTLDFRSDRRRFKMYYDLFASKNDSPPSPDLKTTYDSLRKHIRASPRSQPVRRA